jgi:hypothetical protein
LFRRKNKESYYGKEGRGNEKTHHIAGAGETTINSNSSPFAPAITRSSLISIEYQRYLKRAEHLSSVMDTS